MFCPSSLNFIAIKAQFNEWLNVEKNIRMREIGLEQAAQYYFVKRQRDVVFRLGQFHCNLDPRCEGSIRMETSKMSMIGHR